MNCYFSPALINKQNVNKVDAKGEIQWEDAVDESGVSIMEYNIRYVNASGVLVVTYVLSLVALTIADKYFNQQAF